MIYQQNNKMKRLYFEIWADAIEAANKSESYMTHKDKMFTLMALFTVAQGFNLVVVLLLLSSFFEFDVFLRFDLFPGSYIDTALSGIITLYLPFAVLNYILIFKKKRYLDYTENRKLITKGKALLVYFVCSIILFLLVVIIGKWTL